MVNKHVNVIIMAGGSGQRFWPQSRQKRPKQLLRLFGSETLIQITVKRLSRFVDVKNILVVGTESIIDTLQTYLPEIPPSNILAEPEGRNTAPCIVLAALYLEQQGDSVMVITPADHLVKDEDAFIMVIQSAVEVAANYNEVITIGITPTIPETGYGYIHRGELFAEDVGVYRVKHFVEKPDRAMAEQYLADGNYFWNSGMFVVRVSVLLDLVRQYLPNLYAKIPEMRTAILN